MRCLSILLLAALTTTLPAAAQEFVTGPSYSATAEAHPAASMAPATPSPEMWYYEQYLKQATDPRMAVARAAEASAQQRWLRIESSRWHGYSKSRPPANPDPRHGLYSPGWVIGNPWTVYQINSSAGARPSITFPLH